MNLTFEEQQLTAIFNTGTREGTIVALANMSTELEPDETELRELTASTVGKLRDMSDRDYEALDLVPDFFD